MEIEHRGGEREYVVPRIGSDTSGVSKILRGTQNHLVIASALLTFVFLIWQVVWAISTPAFRSPDEPQHVNSILRVASGRGWPDPGEAYLSASVVQAGREAGMISWNSVGFGLADRTQITERYSADTVPLFSSMTVTVHSERTSMTYSGFFTTEVDQMTQHPPLFYFVEALVFRFFGADDWTWDRQLLLMRVVSAAMTLPLIPSAVYTARCMGAGERASLAAGILAFAIPQLAFITGSVTNDSLTIGLGSLVIASCAAIMTGQGSRRVVVTSGVLLGLALWTKGTAIPLGLTMGLAFLVNPRIGSPRARLRKALKAGSIGLLVGGAWWVRNIVRYGVIQPSGYQSEDKGSGHNTVSFIRTALDSLITSYWGKFDWLSWRLPLGITWMLAIVCTALVVMAIKKATHRSAYLVLLSFTVADACLLLGQAWTQYRDLGVIAGVQGRYLFPGVVGILALVVLALDSKKFATTRRPLIFTAAASAGIAGFSWLAWLRACYPGSPINITRWAEVAGITVVHAYMVALIGFGLLIAVMTIAVRAPLESSEQQTGGQHFLKKSVLQPPVEAGRLRARASSKAAGLIPAREL